MLQAMARILGLPVTDGYLAASEAAPRVDHMRAQLGGRAASSGRVGELVQLRTSNLVSLPGVLLAEGDGSALVLTRGSVVRKAPLNRVEALAPAAPQGAGPTQTPRSSVTQSAGETSAGETSIREAEAQPGVGAAGDLELAAISRAAKRFAQLKEGQRVEVSDPKLGAVEGILVEKCRFGGLVLRGDDSLVAVGFSKLSASAAERRTSEPETPAGQGEQAD